MTFSFGAFKTQLAAIGDERAQVLSRLEKAKQRREDLQTLALPIDEHIEKLCRQVDVRAQEFNSVLERLTGPLKSRPLGDLHPANSLFNDVIVVNTPKLENILCGLLTDQIKAGIKKTAQTWNWPEAGPPLAERKIELTELDKNIAAFENKLREFGNLADQIVTEVGQGNLKRQLSKD